MDRLDQATTLRRPGPLRPAPRILGIVSGKGGVGKSALAANLATACAGAGAKTLLVDGDAGLANADLLLGVVPRFALSDWIEGRTELSEAICSTPGGVDLLVSGSGKRAMDALISATKSDSESALCSLIEARDVTLFDLGAGIGNGVLDLACACDPVWLVVTPEPTSLADAYALARELWVRRPSLKIEIVVNRAPDLQTGERTYQAIQRLTRRFVGREVALRGVLLEDPAMQRAVASQVPVVLSSPSARIARQLSSLAEVIVEDALRETTPRSDLAVARAFVSG